MSRMTIKGYIKASPTRAQLKAEKQVALGKQRALKSRLKGMIQQAKTQIKELDEIGIETPAVKKLRSKTDLSTKGKSYNELQSTYFALERFFKSMTSTKEGALRVLEKTAQIIGQEGIAPAQIYSHASEFFEIASKAEQAMQIKGISAGSPTIMEMIRELQQKYKRIWAKVDDIELKTKIVVKQLEKYFEIQQEDEMGLYIYDKVGVKD